MTSWTLVYLSLWRWAYTGRERAQTTWVEIHQLNYYCWIYRTVSNSVNAITVCIISSSHQNVRTLHTRWSRCGNGICKQTWNKFIFILLDLPPSPSLQKSSVQRQALMEERGSNWVFVSEHLELLFNNTFNNNVHLFRGTTGAAGWPRTILALKHSLNSAHSVRDLRHL